MPMLWDVLRGVDVPPRLAAIAKRHLVRVAPHAAAALFAGLSDASRGQVLAVFEKDGTGAVVEQRLVTGWASVAATADGTPVLDLHGDVIDLDTLAAAAHAFVSGPRTAGIVHEKVAGPDGTTTAKRVGQIVESLVVTPALKHALGLPDATPHGWLITMKVEDDAVWDRVKQGELPMFSIGGLAVPVAAPDLAHLLPDPPTAAGTA